MVRLVGVDLPRNKRILYSLTYIHGIGLTSAKKIVELADISPETRTNDLTTEETVALRQTLPNPRSRADERSRTHVRKRHGG